MRMRSEEQKETSRFDAVECARLAKTRSFGGRYDVVFGNYPDDPEIFEFVVPPKAGRPQGTIYINLNSAPSANVSRVIYA